MHYKSIYKDPDQRTLNKYYANPNGQKKRKKKKEALNREGEKREREREREGIRFRM